MSSHSALLALTSAWSTLGPPGVHAEPTGQAEPLGAVELGHGAVWWERPLIFDRQPNDVGRPLEWEALKKQLSAFTPPRINLMDYKPPPFPPAARGNWVRPGAKKSPQKDGSGCGAITPGIRCDGQGQDLQSG